MKHIFISFKSEQRTEAHLLRNALQALGFAVWWQEDLQCGQRWHAAIDEALRDAACVVVLWSEASLSSPWVQHEASQAIARGIYAPARLDEAKVPSPFDQIQAASLSSWKGEPDHPGFQNLLGRVLRLVPSRSRLERLLGQATKAQRRAAISLAVLVSAAIAALVVYANRLEQRRYEAEAARNIERSLHPLDSIDLITELSLPSDLAGLPAYANRVRAMVLSLADSSAKRSLPEGMSFVTDPTTNKPLQVRISNQSSSWPNSTTDPKLAAILNGLELWLDFYAEPPGSQGRGQYAPSASDLSFWLEPDPPGTQREKTSAIYALLVDIEGTGVHLEFHGGKTRASWSLTGRIVAVPDLQSSKLALRFSHEALRHLANNSTAKVELKNALDKIEVEFLNVRFSGRSVTALKADLLRIESTGDREAAFMLDIRNPALLR